MSPSSGGVFLDTVGLLALANRRDPLHARAIELSQALAETRVQAVTSDWILAEFLASGAAVPFRGTTVQTTRLLLRAPRTRVIPASRRSFMEAFELYANRPDKAWSLVDCSSFLICERLAISDVLTADQHFRQAGFVPLLA
jgi:predicted nucleic acid-binding protein